MSENPTEEVSSEAPAFIAGATFEGLDLDVYAPVKTKVVKDQRFTIFTPKDRTAAYLVIEGGFSKSSDQQARAILKEASIALDALGEAELSSYLIGKGARGGKKGGIRVALGKPPINGEDGKIEWHVVAPESFGVGKESDGGAVDYRERQTFSKVTKGEPICTWHPPTKGEAGRDIFGKTIDPLPGEMNKPRAGVNVSTDGEGKNMSASSDGVVKLEDEAIHVRLMLEVQDVDFASGNIRFDGDVQVNGEVKEGFVVESKGAVQVLKRVHNATLVARSAFVEGPSSGATIESSEHADLKGIEGCTLSVGTNLTLRGHAVASTINVAGALIAEESKIVGGSLNALGEITIASLSGESDLLSDVESIAIPQTKEVDAKREALQEGIDKIASAIASSEEAGDDGKKPKLTLQQKQAMNALRKKSDDLAKALEEADKERRIILHRLMKEMPRGILIKEAVEAGASIVIDGVEWRAEETLAGTWRFKLNEKGDEVLAELQESQEPEEA